ncbi:hypothetical protein RRG08_053378 [Elysia crispata]|uniref:Uncharacterized protein n=1 Tax=Elysia crispata TaxID=231223 RepID=A0AAE0ZGF1_9GAST|nr:hypothetical protein RRG08_053378 [Elysia crispata]
MRGSAPWCPPGRWEGTDTQADDTSISCDWSVKPCRAGHCRLTFCSGVIYSLPVGTSALLSSLSTQYSAYSVDVTYSSPSLAYF